MPAEARPAGMCPAPPVPRPLPAIPLGQPDVATLLQAGEVLAEGRVGELDGVPKSSKLHVVDPDQGGHDADPHRRVEGLVQGVALVSHLVATMASLEAELPAPAGMRAVLTVVPESGGGGGGGAELA